MACRDVQNLNLPHAHVVTSHLYKLVLKHGCHHDVLEHSVRKLVLKHGCCHDVTCHEEPCCSSNMADRPAKLARVLDLRTRLPYCSQTALAALLKAAGEEELPSTVDRQTVARARDDAINFITPYGPIHRTIDVSGFNVEIQDPFSTLYQACAISEDLSELVKRVHARKPSSIAAPWRLLLYWDEITPGNQLAYKSSKKFWAFYWSILEFGSAALADEAKRYTSNPAAVILANIKSLIRLDVGNRLQCDCSLS